MLESASASGLSVVITIDCELESSPPRETSQITPFLFLNILFD